MVRYHVQNPELSRDVKPKVAVPVDDEREAPIEEGSDGGRWRAGVKPTRLVSDEAKRPENEALDRREDTGFELRSDLDLVSDWRSPGPRGRPSNRLSSR